MSVSWHFAAALVLPPCGQPESAAPSPSAGAYVLTLPWLPVLAAHLAGVSGKELSHLPPATEEKLCTTAAGEDWTHPTEAASTQSIENGHGLHSPTKRRAGCPAHAQCHPSVLHSLHMTLTC